MTTQVHPVTVRYLPPSRSIPVGRLRFFFMGASFSPPLFSVKQALAFLHDFPLATQLRPGVGINSSAKRRLEGDVVALAMQYELPTDQTEDDKKALSILIENSETITLAGLPHVISLPIEHADEMRVSGTIPVLEAWCGDTHCCVKSPTPGLACVVFAAMEVGGGKDAGRRQRHGPPVHSERLLLLLAELAFESDAFERFRLPVLAARSLETAAYCMNDLPWADEIRDAAVLQLLQRETNIDLAARYHTK